MLKINDVYPTAFLGQCVKGVPICMKQMPTSLTLSVRVHLCGGARSGEERPLHSHRIGADALRNPDDCWELGWILL